MASNVKVNGVWKTVTTSSSTNSISVKVSGVWKSVTNAYTKVNGTWKQWLAPVASYYAAPVYYAAPTYYAAPISYYVPPISYYAPTYYAPPVVTYYAAPIYYAPPVVTYYAAPIYYTAPTYYAAPAYYRAGGGCWAYGTLVTMADGSLKAIEELIIGDEVRTAVIPTYPNGEDSSKWYPASVWSSDSDEGITYETTTVTGAKHIVDVAYYILNDKYKVTGDHFVYVRKSGVWQFARVEELAVGDYLHDETSAVEITRKVPVNDQLMVVDVDVEPNDLFLANGIITHNVKGY